MYMLYLSLSRCFSFSLALSLALSLARSLSLSLTPHSLTHSLKFCICIHAVMSREVSSEVGELGLERESGAAGVAAQNSTT